MLKALGLLFLTCFLSVSASAEFDLFLTKKMKMPEDVKEVTAFETVSHRAGNSISTTDNSKTVVSKIVDSSLMYWWDNSGIKNTKMGQAVETVQNKMKADVNLGSTGSDKNSNSTKHKLTFRVLAAQALAKIEYFGWFKAAVKYDAKTASSEAELYENLNNNKDLVVTHSVIAGESKSQVSLRWNW